MIRQGMMTRPAHQTSATGLSVVVPLFNEEESVTPLVAAVRDYLAPMRILIRAWAAARPQRSV